MSNLKGSILTRIEDIAKAEKITRVQLAAVSREMLLYVPDSQDIQVVNRLIEVLTPMNRRVAFLFFAHFLPWEVEHDTDKKPLRFGKKLKGLKTIANKAKDTEAFLSEEGNTIWTWTDTNVEVKQKDLRGNITRAIKQALAGHEKSGTAPIPAIDVVMAVMQAGVSMEAMMDGLALQEANIALIDVSQPEETPSEEAPSIAAAE